MKTIEELMEDDIIRFLDELSGNPQDKRKVIRAEEEGMYNVQRDYEREVKLALEQDNLTQAKKVFDELRTSYAKLKYSDIDKPKLFRILDDIHLQIKNYLISKKQEKNIYEEMKTMEPSSQPEKKSTPLDDLYASVEKLINQNNLDGAREEAKKLIQAYNLLNPTERTNEVFERIKGLLVKLQ